MRRAALVVAAVLGVTLLTFAPVATPTAAAAEPTDVIAVVVEGTGYGHGRGMSQWGAYGWAVDYGSSWVDILNHYYGGTVMGDVDTSQARIRVQLKAWDDASTVGVTSNSGGVQWAGQNAPAMYAREIAPNAFAVYRASSVACPTSSGLVVPDGPISWGSSNSAAVRQIQTFLNAFQTGARASASTATSAT